MARTKPDRIPPKKVQRRRNVALAIAPVPMTQEEVDAMAVGRATARTIARRLRVSAPRTSPVRARTEKATPYPLSKEEMAAIEKSGRTSRVIEQRIERSAAAGELVARRPRKVEKVAPKKSPPSKNNR